MHAASIWKKNARKKLNIHDWHIFFVLSVSWNQDTQLVGKPISTSCFIWWPYTSNQELWAETTLFIIIYFFSEDGTVTKICHNVACFLFSPFKFSSEINTKNPKIVVHLITPKISGKKKHLVKYLLCRQSNLSNRRFIFVFRALKLCTGSLNTFLRGT